MIKYIMFLFKLKYLNYIQLVTSCNNIGSIDDMVSCLMSFFYQDQDVDGA